LLKRIFGKRESGDFDGDISSLSSGESANIANHYSMSLLEIVKANDS